MELTEGEARYLLALRDLNSGPGNPPSQAAVARKVGVSHPTALEMIRRLRGAGPRVRRRAHADRLGHVGARWC